MRKRLELLLCFGISCLSSKRCEFKAIQTRGLNSRFLGKTWGQDKKMEAEYV